MNDWYQMTWEEVGHLPAQGMDCAMLPVGATEQHGPHMGCGMDAEIALHLCHAVAAETGVALLPTLPYGCSIGHSKRWPGTIALQPKTMIDIVKQIGDWVYAFLSSIPMSQILRRCVVRSRCCEPNMMAS